MKILIAPNYFKGSLSAVKATKIISDTLKSIKKDITTIECPLADGGDGTIDSIYAVKDGCFIDLYVNDPLYRTIKTNWLKINDSTAIIESARANGLSLLKSDEYNPFITTTYGVGEFIIDALKKECKKIIIGVGGSATNDAGYGALRALGVKFLDTNGKIIESNKVLELKNLSDIDISGIPSKLLEAKILVATDVKNPLTGINGASYTYARQKGAQENELEILDNILAHFANVCTKKFCIDKRNYEGAGAAGGLAYGLAEILGAQIVNGFDIIADLVNLENKIQQADIVITGEGKLDYQTLWGKVPFRVSELARQHGKPCIVIAGDIEPRLDHHKYYNQIYTLTSINISPQEAINRAEILLKQTIINHIDKICKS